MGDRPEALARAVSSAHEQAAGGNAVGEVLVIANTSNDLADAVPAEARLVSAGANLGVPGGRDFGVAECSAPILGFLDDDAVLSPGATVRIVDAFAQRPELGAVSLRLVDELGQTARRHVPRRGESGAGASGDVALFLGGACAIRRDAYEAVGGYFTELHYGHEELELCWRLVDRGWAISYLADVTVFHPRTEISRHADGWKLTGRNRVWIARRTLPWPIAIVHVTLWLIAGLQRAPHACRRAYLGGWLSGWRGSVGRAPIGWRTVWRLGQLGRLPLM